MNINEIIKALRGTCDQCNPTPCCEFEVLGDEAAKLIETLQLRLVELESKLSAAVEDMRGYCKACENLPKSLDYEELAKSTCRECNKIIRQNWEWRGTKYTEEGVKE